ncbi:hypothetical protein GF325_11945 [Candidatus Bathyarchaeota archaeon]|nr:hypothetical protein [Candidatus Bathyarchaeota archaeon]
MHSFPNGDSHHMSIIICPSCGNQFQQAKRRQGTIKCPRCGFPIPVITRPVSKPSSHERQGSRGDEHQSRPKPIPFQEATSPSVLDEFTDQPSPFGPSSTREKDRDSLGKNAGAGGISRSNKEPALIPITDVEISAPRMQKTIEQKKRTPSPARESTASEKRNKGSQRVPSTPPTGSEIKMVPISRPPKKDGSHLSNISDLVHKQRKESKDSSKGRKTGISSISVPENEMFSVGVASTTIGKETSKRRQVDQASTKKQSTISDLGPRTARDLESTMKTEIELFRKQAKRDGMQRPKNKPQETQELKKVSVTDEPESLNEILKDLVKIDQFIKASALVKRDGTILASAISSQVSDSLIAVIATTVSNIAKDIVFATESGELKYITISGSKGIVHLVPIIAEIFLVILTSAGSKRGVVEVMARHVEKKTKKYLNI